MNTTDVILEDHPLAQAFYPDPFMPLMKETASPELALLKEKLGLARTDLNDRLKQMSQSDDHYIRVRDKRRWLLKKQLAIVAELATRKSIAKQQEADACERNKAAAEQKRLEKEAEKEKAKAAVKPEPKQEPPKKSHIVLWFEVDGEPKVEIHPCSLNVEDWWVEKVKNLPEYEYRLVPALTGFRSITQEAYDKLPDWIKQP